MDFTLGTLVQHLWTFHESNTRSSHKKGAPLPLNHTINLVNRFFCVKDLTHIFTIEFKLEYEF